MGLSVRYGSIILAAQTDRNLYHERSRTHSHLLERTLRCRRRRRYACHLGSSVGAPATPPLQGFRFAAVALSPALPVLSDTARGAAASVPPAAAIPHAPGDFELENTRTGSSACKGTTSPDTAAPRVSPL